MNYVARPVLEDAYGAHEILRTIREVMPRGHADIFRIFTMDHVTISTTPPEDWASRLPDTNQSFMSEVVGKLQVIEPAARPQKSSNKWRSSRLRETSLIGYQLDSSDIEKEITAIRQGPASKPHISIIQLKPPDLCPERTDSKAWLQWLIDELYIPTELSFRLGPTELRPFREPEHDHKPTQQHAITTIGDLFDFSSLSCIEGDEAVGSGTGPMDVRE